MTFNDRVNEALSPFTVNEGVKEIIIKKVADYIAAYAKKHLAGQAEKLKNVTTDDVNKILAKMGEILEKARQVLAPKQATAEDLMKEEIDPMELVKILAEVSLLGPVALYMLYKFGGDIATALMSSAEDLAGVIRKIGGAVTSELQSKQAKPEVKKPTPAAPMMSKPVKAGLPKAPPTMYR